MNITISASASILCAAFLLLALPAGVAVAEDLPAIDPAPAESLLVLVEAWRTGDSGLIAETEALTERSPSDAAAVWNLLKSSGDAAQRLSRFLTSSSDGKSAHHTGSKLVATPGDASADGSHEVGTELQLTARLRPDGLVEAQVQVEVKGADEAATEGGVPEPFVARIQAKLAVPLGTSLMFQSSVLAKDTIFVFVRFTRPTTDSSPAREAGEEPTFTDTEIRWFKALKAFVDAQEREERYQTMIERQLARVGLELTPEQTAQVIALTIAYRAKVRDAYRTGQAEGQSREDRSALVEGVRAEFEAAVYDLLPAMDAEKVVQSLGRSPGFGPREGSGRGGR